MHHFHQLLTISRPCLRRKALVRSSRIRSIKSQKPNRSKEKVVQIKDSLDLRPKALTKSEVPSLLLLMLRANNLQSSWMLHIQFSSTASWHSSCSLTRCYTARECYCERCSVQCLWLLWHSQRLKYTTTCTTLTHPTNLSIFLMSLTIWFFLFHSNQSITN